MTNHIDFIKDITISKMQWKLKVRVVRMWKIPDRFNPGNIFSIELVLQDEKGDRIHASIGKSVLHLFNTKINELRLYLMANFIVCQNKERRNKLSATFWGEFVDQVIPYLLSSNNQPVIVVIQLIKAHKYQDSYSVRNTWNTSKLWINPTFPQSDEFKRRLLSVRDISSERLTQTISQQSYSVSDELEKGIAEVKIIAQLVESMQSIPGRSLLIVASIKNLELGKGWSYVSCKKCQKKVDKVGKIYQCPNPKCKNEDNSAVIRYKLQVRVMDTTGSVSLLLWDREAMFLIGKSAKELKEGFLANTGVVDKYPYPVELNNVLERKFMFKVIVKSSNIQLQQEVYSVVKLTDEEQLIRKYSPDPPSFDLTDPEFNNNQDFDGEKECEDSTEESELTDISKTLAKMSLN
ncbi:PREDICTED: uncharacterized protein LOC109208414 [Nicotiana attenuata]|uniref:uncharacterized protein LOC109208414 n=1 Tax=Nicotiana attenuata TaxID=49451 RepID=UPI000904FBE1|nr:PREDICTED: uncharacterized protein LOC109208414 [Nicotiana attenuata]